jgi:hypothetical protein
MDARRWDAIASVVVPHALPRLFEQQSRRFWRGCWRSMGSGRCRRSSRDGQHEGHGVWERQVVTPAYAHAMRN